MVIGQYNKIRVLRVITRLNIGGPAIHTILLSGGLNRDGFQDILVAGKPGESEGDMGYFAKENGVEPIIISNLRREPSFFNDIMSLLKLYSIIRKGKPHIVHTHTAKAGAVGRLAAVLAGVPVRIHTFHGHIFDGYFSPMKARVFMLIERFLGYFTDAAIVVSKAVKDDIVGKMRIIPENKCRVVELGLDLEKFLNSEKVRGVFRKEIGAGQDTLLIGIVGRLVPIKNHEMFLEVIKNIKERMPELKVKFIIIGDGELRPYIERLVLKSGLEDRVILTGWVKDLSAAYADLDIVALTSLNEGTPVSLIEAMASARPVISTAIGGVKDMVTDGKNGLLAESGNVKDFADKLISLINDEGKRARLAAAGREFAVSRYDKKRLIREIEDLYKGCLERKGILSVKGAI